MIFRSPPGRVVSVTKFSSRPTCPLSENLPNLCFRTFSSKAFCPPSDRIADDRVTSPSVVGGWQKNREGDGSRHSAKPAANSDHRPGVSLFRLCVHAE